MDDLKNSINFLIGYVNAINNGVNNAMVALPVIANQTIKAKAKQKLGSTYDNYMNSIKQSMSETIFVIEIDEENWLANAVEAGADSFGMKEGLLNSRNAKINKEGFKYARVPIGKKEGANPGTEKGKEYQKLVDFVMNKPKFGTKTYKLNQDGSVIESQKVETDESVLQGLYRFRVHDSPADAYSSGSNASSYSLVLFRTVSEGGSKTGATWEHPGIKPAHIMRDVERELPTIFEALLDESISKEIEKFTSSGGGF